MEKKLSKEEFIDYTLRVFQPRTSRVLTREDAREIAENVVGFFSTLRELKKSKASQNVHE